MRKIRLYKAKAVSQGNCPSRDQRLLDSRVDEDVVLGRESEADTAEEHADDHDEDREGDEDEQRRADTVEDLLEVTFFVRASDEGGRLTDERLLGGGADDRDDLAALNTASVESSLADKLVDGERFTGDSRLVDGEDTRATDLLDNVLVVVIVVVVTLLAAGLALLRLLNLLQAVLDVDLLAFIVVAKDAAVGGNSRAFFEDDLRGGTNAVSNTFRLPLAANLQLTISPGTSSRASISCS